MERTKAGGNDRETVLDLLHLSHLEGQESKAVSREGSINEALVLQIVETFRERIASFPNFVVKVDSCSLSACLVYGS